jgi:uncharacterized NAD-dependent epimerase/dehydratase family protein
VCHEPGRKHLLGYPDYPTPPLPEAIDRHVAMGSLTNRNIRCAGISLNTATMPPSEAASLMRRTSESIGLPVADPMRGGASFEGLIESCLAG